jgi:hypothetical protein
MHSLCSAAPNVLRPHPGAAAADWRGAAGGLHGRRRPDDPSLTPYLPASGTLVPHGGCRSGISVGAAPVLATRTVSYARIRAI